MTYRKDMTAPELAELKQYWEGFIESDPICGTCGAVDTQHNGSDVTHCTECFTVEGEWSHVYECRTCHAELSEDEAAEHLCEHGEDPARDALADFNRGARNPFNPDPREEALRDNQADSVEAMNRRNENQNSYE